MNPVQQRPGFLFFIRMKTLIAGYGNLGKIYASALLKHNLVKQEELYILCKTGEQQKLVDANGHGFALTADQPLNIKPDLVLLVVKPQDFDSVIKAAKPYLHQNTLVLSVMAGISITTLSEKLNHQKIVRAMPNSPIEIGMGMTGYSASPALSLKDIQLAEMLLSTTGRTLYFEDEQLLNAVTALSGSGPAYFFYLLQCMIEAGQQLGFSEAVSTTLVKQTMLGSFHLYNHSGKSAAELIKTVASKGGTTEAAFHVFDENKLGETLISGILKANERAVELNRS